MNTENYYKNEEGHKNEIRIEDDELNLDKFVLNDKKNVNNQVLFHEVLKILIDKYNTLSEEERREEGIFYLKDRNILLGNINEEVVQSYYKYKELFDGLMSGKSRFFREYDPKLDNDNNKAFSETNSRKKNENECALFISEYCNECFSSNSCKIIDYRDYCNRQKKNKV